jgi:PAS domain-containing protein
MKPGPPHAMSTGDPSSLRRERDKLLDHLPSGVVAHGPDGRILSANQQARALLGQAEAQLIGTESGEKAWSLARSGNTVMARRCRSRMSKAGAARPGTSN